MSAMSDNVGQYGRLQQVPVVEGADVPLTLSASPYPSGRGVGADSHQDTFSSSAGPSAPPPAPPPATGWFAAFTVGFYRPYFDVDTVDVAGRMRDAMLPLRSALFMEKTALNPDIYGPFWICTTLVFLSAALGNLASYLSYAASSTAATWHYDIDAVSWAAGLFYGYVAVVPLLLFLLLRYLQVSVGLVQLWCLYGYSLSVYVPISFISIVPIDFLRWLIVMGATAISCFFLGTNLRAQITIGHEMWFPIVVGAVALQAGLGVLLKLYFFTYIEL